MQDSHRDLLDLKGLTIGPYYSTVGRIKVNGAITSFFDWKRALYGPLTPVDSVFYGH